MSKELLSNMLRKKNKNQLAEKAEEFKKLEAEEEAKCIEERIWKNCNLVRMQEDTSNLIDGKIKNREYGKPLLPC